jgi:hypothetical protein
MAAVSAHPALLMCYAGGITLLERKGNGTVDEVYSILKYI